MSLKLKLTLFCLFIGLLPVTVVGVHAVRVASSSLSDQARQQLESVRDAKGAALAALVRTWQDEVRVYAGVKEVYNALNMLRDQAMGIARDKRMDPLDPAYADLHAYVAGSFRPFVERLGYPDALLVSDDGRIVFTAAKGRDLGENLVHGALLKDTNLRRAFERAMRGETAMADLESYPALAGHPAAFAAAPVHDHLGVVTGVAVLRLPMKRIDAIMTQRTGMGLTGRTYLVGSDGRRRSSVPGEALPGLGGRTASLETRDARGEAILAAVAPVAFGNTSWDLVAEIQAHEAFAPVRSLRLAALVAGALVVLLATGTAMLTIHRTLVRPLEAVDSYLERVTRGDMRAELQGRFTGELDRLAQGVRSMFCEVKQRLAFAQGVLGGVTQPCMVVSAQGLVSHCNQALLDMLGRPGMPQDHLGSTPGELLFGEPGRQTLTTRALRDQRAVRDETELTARDGRTLVVNVTATPIYDLDGNPMGVFTLYYDLTPIRAGERRIREQHETMASVAAQASGIAVEVSTAASELEHLVDGVSRGATLQSERTEQTAASMQQMASTTMEMARSASSAAHSAADARQRADAGREAVQGVIASVEEVRRLAEALQRTMDNLSGEAGRIGGIITVIDDIADQTNLLALNAAIEAARAGEAGRGFAVVADEVRKLAEKTMAATREVGQVVAAIQRDTRQSVEAGRQAARAVEASSTVARESGQAIQVIVDIVQGTAGQVQSIATASEEQSAAGDQINAAVEEISRISRDTAQGMRRSQQAITQLNAQAARLTELMASLRA